MRVDDTTGQMTQQGCWYVMVEGTARPVRRVRGPATALRSAFVRTRSLSSSWENPGPATPAQPPRRADLPGPASGHPARRLDLSVSLRHGWHAPTVRHFPVAAADAEHADGAPIHEQRRLDGRLRQIGALLCHRRRATQPGTGACSESWPARAPGSCAMKHHFAVLFFCVGAGPCRHARNIRANQAPLRWAWPNYIRLL